MQSLEGWQSRGKPPSIPCRHLSHFLNTRQDPLSRRVIQLTTFWWDSRETASQNWSGWLK
ncbi:hypothetical protein [Dictyobacter formicarum]|uniref:hypothetical protein n=1 Tax=Dictyobacter formicarum TaxID=2778368 RepID=UPI001915C6B3|nr:hypothetical protein [Dictyobacter formicarum]